MKKLLLILALCCILSPRDTFSQLFWDQAASFSGSNNSYLALPNSSKLNITGSFTLECLIKPESVTQTQALICKKIGSLYTYMLALNSSAKIVVGTNNSTRLTSILSVPEDKWTHVAATYNAATNLYVIYINGAVGSSTAVPSSAPSASNDSLQIGRMPTGLPFTGLMDNVRIWDRALTEAEVNANSRTSLGVPSAAGTPFANLVLSLPFQNRNSQGNPFSLSDWSYGGHLVYNRGVTQVNFTNTISTSISYNEAMEFDGNGDYLAMPHAAASDVTGAFTMEAWVYLKDSSYINHQTVIKKKGDGVAPGYNMVINNSTRFVVSVNNIGAGVSERFPIKRWVHIAFTLSSTGTGNFYIDGELKNSTDYPMPGTNTDSLFIGGTTGNDYFNGYIDEVRISKYEKTGEQIRKYMYRSEEINNDPNPSATDLVFNFDGYSHSNCDASGYLFFRGNSKFSNPNTRAGAPVSPLLRYEYGNFPNGYRMKTVNKRLPETGTSGTIYDTITVNSGTTITDINVFTAVNHSFDGDIEIMLFAPNGDSAAICMDRLLLGGGYKGDIIGIFDSNADSSLQSNVYTSFSPSIKPESDINAIFGGDNSAGSWIIRFTDDAPDDTGYVYAWGINFNNQSVGVQNVSNTVPQKYELEQNYPNPFNPVTNIKFSIPESGLVKIKVFDILGKEVAVLVNEFKQAGTYKVDFNGTRLSSGAYFYRLETGSFTDTKKMLLVK
jgi:subtilisin-like proprotein convertase family protein